MSVRLKIYFRRYWCKKSLSGLCTAAMACLGSSRTNIHVALRAVCMGILCQIQIFFPIEFYFGFYNHVNLRLLPPMTVWRKDSFSGRGWHVAAHVQWIPRLGGAQTLPIRLIPLSRAAYRAHDPLSRPCRHRPAFMWKRADNSRETWWGMCFPLRFLRCKVRNLFGIDIFLSR